MPAEIMPPKPMPVNAIKEKHSTAKEQQSRWEWQSFKVKKRNLLPLLATTLLLIAGVTIVLVLSLAQNGFGLPRKQYSETGALRWQLSLTWTFVPSFLLQAYALWLGTTVEAFGFRQPFIELARGATASKSIALDYSSFWPVQREIKAWRNGHKYLCTTFLLSLLVKLTLGPLGGHILAAGSYDRKVNLKQDSALFTTVTQSGDMGWDLQSILSLASARLSDSSFGTWSNGNETYLNFSLPDTHFAANSRPELAAPTSAYYSTLDCSLVSDLAQHTQWILDNNGDNTKGRVFFNSSDSSCDWTINTAFGPDSPTHFETFSTTRCPDSTGRLIVVAGTIESSIDNNLSVVACKPTYWTSAGTLSLDLTTNTLHPIVSWNVLAGSVIGDRPQWWNIFEDQLQQLTSVDLSGNSISVTTTPMGKVIYDEAETLSDTPWDPAILFPATQKVWAGIYSTLIETTMIKPTGHDNTIQGHLTTSNDRLFVVVPIAGVVLGLLGVIFLAVLLVAFYTKTHMSVLREEPIGLLGASALLANSDLNDEVVRLKQCSRYEGKASEIYLQNLVTGPVHPKTFRMIDLEDARNCRLVTERHVAVTEQEATDNSQTAAGRSGNARTSMSPSQTRFQSLHIGRKARTSG